MGVSSTREEGLIGGSSIEDAENIDANIKKCVCKIKTTEKTGSGFFLKFEINDKFYYYLISCEHVITKDIIEKNETIQIFYGNELYQIDVELVEKERYIKNFEDLYLDITVVEIIKNDNIDEEYFLLAEPNLNKEKLINRRIYVLHYPLGEKLKVSEGTIKKKKIMNLLI